jgi:hypothetical protein
LSKRLSGCCVENIFRQRIKAWKVFTIKQAFDLNWLAKCAKGKAASEPRSFFFDISLTNNSKNTVLYLLFDAVVFRGVLCFESRNFI